MGDNIFYGQDFSVKLAQAVEKAKIGQGATVFGYQVKDPERFGVVDFDNNKKVISIEEKPLEPKSQFAVTGLYFYDNSVIDFARQVKPSKRGELEISCINNTYLEENKLNIEILGRGFAWLDTGTHESLLEASQFVEMVEKRQGFKIACLEEIAFNKGWLNRNDIIKLAEPLMKNQYGQYLLDLIKH